MWLEFEASSEELGDQNNSNSSGGTGTRGIVGGTHTSPKIKYDSLYYDVNTWQFARFW